jgi:tetratricopeptide (TPR) repeat protein
MDTLEKVKQELERLGAELREPLTTEELLAKLHVYDRTHERRWEKVDPASELKEVSLGIRTFLSLGWPEVEYRVSDPYESGKLHGVAFVGSNVSLELSDEHRRRVLYQFGYIEETGAMLAFNLLAEYDEPLVYSCTDAKEINDADVIGNLSQFLARVVLPGYATKDEWFALIREAHAAGDRLKSLDLCEAALTQNPRVADLLHVRGMLQAELRLDADAEASYREVLALEPWREQTQNRLSRLLLAQQRNDEAEALMKPWVYQTPDVATLHYDLGLVASRRWNKQQALEALAEALRLNPELAGDAPTDYRWLRDDPDFHALLVAEERQPNPLLWYWPKRFTSRPAPIDLGKNFPELKPRPGIRLHPRTSRSGPLLPDASKMGGVFLANDGRAWPTCDEHGGAPYTAVMQLRAADVPRAPFPNSKDVFQLLWCAHAHETNGYAPRMAVRWLQSRELPPPAGANPRDEQADEDYVPRECALYPETVADYPDRGELYDIEDRLKADPELSALGEKLFPPENVRDGAATYQYICGAADGTKLIGYPDWVQDPRYPLWPRVQAPDGAPCDDRQHRMGRCLV